MKWFVLFALLAVTFAQEGATEDQGTEDGTADVPATTTKPSLASKIGGEVLKGVGEGVNEIVGGITDMMDKDSSAEIKENAGKASNAATLVELMERIKNGDLVVPAFRKRALTLPTKEELLGKLGDMYDNIKTTIDENAARAEELYNKAKEDLKAAYDELKENENVKDLETAVKGLINDATTKVKEIAGLHKRRSLALRESLNSQLVSHLDAHFSPEVSRRFARSVGSVVDSLISSLELKVQKVVDVINDKTSEYYEKIVTPILAKLEEIKAKPAVQEKLSALSDLKNKINAEVKKLLNGEKL